MNVLHSGGVEVTDTRGNMAAPLSATVAPSGAVAGSLQIIACGVAGVVSGPLCKTIQRREP